MADDPENTNSLYVTAFSARWFEELLASLTVMIRVIYALIIREARTRYGNSNLGYTWALIDPVIQLIVWIVLFSAIGRLSPVAAPLSVFLITGIMPFFFWRGCMSRGSNAVSSNLALISYPQVTAADVVIGRTVLEASTTLIVFVLLVMGLALLAGISPAEFFGNPSELVLAMLGLGYFGLGTAFFSSGLGRVWTIWPNITSYINRPLYILSGIFFTLESLPTGAREFMAYNPVAHIIEWIRSAAIPNFESDAYSRTYVLAFGTVAFAIGLVIDRYMMMTGDEEIVS